MEVKSTHTLFTVIPSLVTPIPETPLFLWQILKYFNVQIINMFTVVRTAARYAIIRLYYQQEIIQTSIWIVILQGENTETFIDCSGPNKHRCNGKFYHLYNKFQIIHVWTIEYFLWTFIFIYEITLSQTRRQEFPEKVRRLALRVAYLSSRGAITAGPRSPGVLVQNPAQTFGNWFSKTDFWRFSPNCTPIRILIVTQNVDFNSAN